MGREKILEKYEVLLDWYAQTPPNHSNEITNLIKNELRYQTKKRREQLLNNWVKENNHLTEIKQIKNNLKNVLNL